MSADSETLLDGFGHCLGNPVSATNNIKNITKTDVSKEVICDIPKRNIYRLVATGLSMYTNVYIYIFCWVSKEQWHLFNTKFTRVQLMLVYKVPLSTGTSSALHTAVLTCTQHYFSHPPLHRPWSKYQEHQMATQMFMRVLALWHSVFFV